MHTPSEPTPPADFSDIYDRFRTAHRGGGGVTIACIAIPRQSVGEGCDGNRFRGRVHMGSGDWRVWKTLFNPGKALKRSDGHRGAGEEYTQLRCFGRRPHSSSINESSRA